MNYYVLRVYYPHNYSRSLVDAAIEDRKKSCEAFLPPHSKVLVIDNMHHDKEYKGVEWNLEVFHP